MTQHDLQLLRDKAISYYIGYAPRCCLEGSLTDLNEEQKRQLAHLESAVLLLNQHGCMNMDAFKVFFPGLYSRSQELIEDGMCSFNSHNK